MASNRRLPVAALYLEKLLRWTIVILMLFMLWLFHLEPINLITADLGRHIKNGESTLTQGLILKTNHYSFTQPDYPSINHHWGSGVIFYLLQRFFGFKGLAYIYAGLFFVTIALIFQLSLRRANFWIVAFCVILYWPLLVTRTEIRPEGFGYVLLALYLWLLVNVKDGRWRSRSLWLLPITQVFWVNLHISFIFGPFLIAVYAVAASVRKEEVCADLWKVCLVSAAACLVNPFFLNGALAPFTIFRDYQYQLAENQSVFFMIKRFPGQMVYPHFIGAFVVTMLGCVAALGRESLRKYIEPLALVMAFALLAFGAIRGFKSFALVAMLFGPQFYQIWLDRYGSRVRNLVLAMMGFVVVSLLLVSATSRGHYYSPYLPLNLAYRSTHWMEDVTRPWLSVVLRNFNQLTGLFPDINRSAEFFKAEKLSGAIFNNYDIGGYLIYHLFPQEQVFVDNRPESYSGDFFQKIYIPMQQSEDVWKKYEQQYDFNVIYFSRHDLTPWAQPFLIRRLQDPAWAPVYTDAFVLILLKRNDENRSVIERFEIPKSNFRTASEKYLGD